MGLLRQRGGVVWEPEVGAPAEVPLVVLGLLLAEGSALADDVGVPLLPARPHLHLLLARLLQLHRPSPCHVPCCSSCPGNTSCRGNPCGPCIRMRPHHACLDPCGTPVAAVGVPLCHRCAMAVSLGVAQVPIAGSLLFGSSSSTTAVSGNPCSLGPMRSLPNFVPRHLWAIVPAV